MANAIKTNEEIMQKIYTELHNTIAPKVGNDPPSDLFCMFTIGRAVYDDYDIRPLADNVPKVNKNYAESGNRVSGGYNMALSCHFQNEPGHNPKEEENYKKAIKTLYVDYGTEDQEQTPNYTRYKKARKKWVMAKIDLDAAKNNPNYPKNGNRREDIPSIKELEYDVNEAFNDFTAAHRDEIETALDLFNGYNSFIPSAYVNILKTRYIRAREDGFPIDMPADWTTEKFLKKLAWKKVSIMSNAESSELHESVSSMQSSFSDSYKYGFWFFSSGGAESQSMSSSTKDLRTENTSEKFSLALEVAEIPIERNWVDLSFFSYKDVYIENEDPGVITMGGINPEQMKKIDKCVMPLMPSSIVLTRNVSVYSDFSQDVYKFVETAKSSSYERSSYGPFSCGSRHVKYSDSSKLTDEENKKYLQASKIEFPDIQIIGVKCAITSPMFPAGSLRK